MAFRTFLNPIKKKTLLKIENNLKEFVCSGPSSYRSFAQILARFKACIFQLN